MAANQSEKPVRKLSPVSRRAFLLKTPAAMIAGAAALAGCGGGYGDFYANYVDVYGDYGDCVYCDYGDGVISFDYTCCDGRFYCDGWC